MISIAPRSPPVHPKRSATGVRSSTSSRTAVRNGTVVPLSSRMIDASSPWRAARHLFSRTSHARGVGSVYPRSIITSNWCTRHWLSAATTPTSRSVGIPSHTRISTVPKLGCGRMSHHTSRIVLMVCDEISVSISCSNCGQPLRSQGGPAVGRPSNTFERHDDIPVSSPMQYGVTERVGARADELEVARLGVLAQLGHCRGQICLHLGSGFADPRDDLHRRLEQLLLGLRVTGLAVRGVHLAEDLVSPAYQLAGVA